MNCKPGDLAYIVGLKFSVENIGMVVEVIRPAVPKEIFHSKTGKSVGLGTCHRAWVIRSCGKPIVWRTPDCELGMFDIAPIGDENLRPISGVPVTEDVEDEVPA
jgi:hypothetical protein